MLLVRQRMTNWCAGNVVQWCGIHILSATCVCLCVRTWMRMCVSLTLLRKKVYLHQSLSRISTTAKGVSVCVCVCLCVSTLHCRHMIPMFILSQTCLCCAQFMLLM